MKNIKMNQTVFIITPNFEKFSILKGKISGCYQVENCIHQFRYIVDTCLGRYERFPDAIYSSPKEIADNIGDYVVEDASEGK